MNRSRICLTLLLLAGALPAQSPLLARLHRMTPVVSLEILDLAAGDVDGDGDLDVIAGCIGQNRLFLNDGSGVFTDGTSSRLPSGPSGNVWVTTSVLLVDLDGDGDLDGDQDLDIVVTARDRNRVYVNRTRQLSWRNVPRFAKPLQMDVSGPAGAAWRIAVSLGTTSLSAQPWGTLRIDPASMMRLGTGVLDAQGRGSLTLLIPPDPGGLAGVTIYGQALVGTAQPRLSNLELLTFTDL